MDDLTPPRASAPQQPTATVPTGRGSAWWSEGWRLFAAAPGTWIGITVLCVVLMLMISRIPMLGTLATTFLAPVFAGGVLVGCRAIDRGGELTIGHLFASFSDRLAPLLIVGLLYLVGTFVIMLLVVGGLVATIGIGGFGALLSGDPLQAGIAILATLGIGALLAVLFGLLLGIPLMMAYWFAPALIVFRNDEPVAAMRASFDACLVNMMPMFLYSLLGLAFALVATIPFGLGWLVLAPVFAGSVYSSYKDIFGAPD
jgi:uncharacterized membrane protein